MEQRSKEWFDARKGRFTGSEIHKLMGVKGLGKTGESYAFKKACEVVFGINEEEQFTSFDMQRGIDLEPVAFNKIKTMKGVEFISVQECSFYSKGENAGASPDGVIDKDGVLEIKCPKPDKFFNLVAKGIDAIDKEYMFQMQNEIWVTNSDYACFFNYVIFNGVEMWHEIRVERNDETIKLIESRIEEAIILRDEYIIQLKENKQF